MDSINHLKPEYHYIDIASVITDNLKKISLDSVGCKSNSLVQQDGTLEIVWVCNIPALVQPDGI